MSTRICRAHDADDVVPDRVCGHLMPCPDHPRGWQGMRLKTTPAMRSRKNTLFTLSEAALKRLREEVKRQSRPASRIVEELILTRLP